MNRQLVWHEFSVRGRLLSDKSTPRIYVSLYLGLCVDMHHLGQNPSPYLYMLWFVAHDWCSQELVLLMLPLLKLISIKKILAPFSSGQTGALNLRDGACPICEAFPVIVPYITIPCGHLYCYFCLRTRCISNSSFQCLKCNTQVGAIKRHHFEVSVETTPDWWLTLFGNLISNRYKFCFTFFPVFWLRNGWNPSMS